ncbi:hypothetical protein CsatB_007555 [Cannabis sativa]|uniref:uncharacterized protein LOC115720421 n=1 Tax=Cannabis sativa TaxID=3483 RepID=UPI0011DF125A|nr:uncharacterized protein LOC115720421 [Cannabis sativa]
MWGRLNTKERLAKYDVSIDETCLLCGKEKESIKHLFFACDYSRNCLQEVKNWLHWRLNAESVQGIIKNIKNNKSSSATRRSMLKVVIAGLIYHIWEARNDVLWNQKMRRIQAVVKHIQRESKLRIIEIMPKKTKDVDREWIVNI